MLTGPRWDVFRLAALCLSWPRLLLWLYSSFCKHRTGFFFSHGLDRCLLVMCVDARASGGRRSSTSSQSGGRGDVRQ